MARARNLKPGFFHNEELAELSPLVRLFFQGLWCEADRRGILEDRPKRLKAAILPYDDFDADDGLNQLQAKGLITRYEVDGARCIYIPKFGKHQNPHVKEPASTLPAPDEHRASTGLAPDMHETSPAESLLLTTDSLEPSADAAETRAGSRDRTTRIPDDFAPDDQLLAWAAAKGFTPPEIQHHTEAFCGHFRVKGGKDARKLDWRQTWQNWLLRETPGRWPGAIRQLNGQGRHPPPNGPRPRTAQELADLARLRGAEP